MQVSKQQEEAFAKAQFLAEDLFNHGFGEFTFKVTSLKDKIVKIEIACGKTYVFFIKKETPIDARKLL